MQPRKIEQTAFIGFGLSGLSEFCSYVEKAIAEHQQPNITIFEKHKEHFAAGMPYHSEVPSVWNLNGPCADEFQIPANGKTLKTWMDENQQDWKIRFPLIDPKYPPRALVGEYLKAQYQFYKQLAEDHGIQVNECYEEVLNLERNEQNQFVLSSQSGNHIADFVGLAIGHLSQDNFQKFKGQGNFIANPWDPKELEKIPKNVDEVVVIGGHLTFIDVAKYLSLVHEFTGKFSVVTRHPTMIIMRDNDFEFAEAPLKNLANKFLTYKDQKLTFQEAKTLFWETYERETKKTICLNINTQSALTAQLAIYNKSSEPTDSRVDELHAYIDKFFRTGCYRAMWDAMNDKAQEEFSKQLYSTILAFLVGVPASSARFLKELYDAQRIQEHSGMQELLYDENNREYILAFSDGTKKSAQYVINATGPGRDITKHFAEFPLLEKLIKKNMLSITPYGGIITNNYNQVITKDGQAIPNLIAVGPCVYKGMLSPEASFVIAPLAKQAMDEHFNNQSHRRI